MKAIFPIAAFLVALSQQHWPHFTSANLSAFSRNVLMYIQGWGSTSPDEVKLVNQNKASCYLSLNAHADRVMESLPDPFSFGKLLLNDAAAYNELERNFAFEKESIVTAGCPRDTITEHLRARVNDDMQTVVNIEFNINLPPGIQLPLYKGRINRNCEVRTQDQPQRLLLANVNISRVDGHIQEPESYLLTNGIGALDVVLDLSEDSLVDSFLLLSCSDRDDIEKRYVPLRKNVRTGEVRELLHRSGIEPDLARSFMVIGFHSGDL